MTEASKDLLLSSFTFKNGGVIPNRVAMAPMCIFSSNPDGTVSPYDIEEFAKRPNVAGMVITGAANVQANGKLASGAFGVYDDCYISGLRDLATTIQKGGNKAILQIVHGGREAAGSTQLGLTLKAPSAMEFPWISAPVEALTHEEVLEIIENFGHATRRAIAAGFDGVEIHGANHYLIQQFFSAFSNKRTDNWGGSLEKRMNFPLAVVDAVLKVVKASDKKDFIVGYRITPEEIHGENVGYYIDDALALIDKIADSGLDYIHTSVLALTKYDAYSVQHPDKRMANLVHDTLNGRCAYVIASRVETAEDAIDALNYGDIVGIGRMALLNPDIIDKIKHDIPFNQAYTPDMDFFPKAILAIFNSPGGARIAASLPIQGTNLK